MTSTEAAVDHRFRVIRAAGDVGPAEIRERLAITVEVVVRDGGHFRLQLVALALVELLARLFPSILIDVDPAAETHAAIPGPRTLAGLLVAARDRGHPLADAGTPAITVVVGARSEASDVVVDAFGWQSYVGGSPAAFGNTDSLVAIGPLCAAARAAARVFQLAFAGLIRDAAPAESMYWNALSYEVGGAPFAEPDLPAPVALDAVLVGAGSVGGAALYAFRYTPGIGGRLVVIDPQLLEDRNYVRAILASHQAAHENTGKVALAADTLRDTQLICDPQPMTIADYVASRPREALLPLVLSSVDSIESRRSIQDCLPLGVVDAACDHERARVSRHVTDDGPCLYCMYIDRVLDGKAIRLRLIARATGFSLEDVSRLLVEIGRMLSADEVAAIERYREKPSGAYAAYVGKPLAELYDSELLYGEALVGESGDIAVAAPFVTALTGFLLAGEALKAAHIEYAQFQLGASGGLTAVGGANAVKYEEPLFTPEGALLQAVPRSPSPACLCNSARRLELLRERRALQASQ